MTYTELQRALVGLGIKAPHNIPIGHVPGGEVAPVTQAEWDAYQWNPPQYFRTAGTFTVKGVTFTIEPEMVSDVGSIDSNASEKPTWSELLRGLGTHNLSQIREDLSLHLKTETRQRITEAYGQDNHHDEIELRLGGRHTEAQDAERDRLRARYTIIKNWIESTDRTLAELEALDLNDDANWTGTTWPPNRGTL